MTEFEQNIKTFKEAGLFNDYTPQMLSYNKVVSVNKFMPKNAYKPFKMKQCFSNAVKMLEQIGHRDDAFYCEGYVSHNNSIPIEHAWVMVGYDIIDPTFEVPLKISIENMNKEEYALIKKYSLKEVYDNMYRFKSFGPWWNRKYRDVA